MRARYVFDASALLCLINGERGWERVEGRLNDAAIGAVNFSEVVAKLTERGVSPARMAETLDPLHLDVVNFDRAQAMAAGELRARTRELGLSFGDRACLALAVAQGSIALTADRAWMAFSGSLQIELIRG